LAGKKRGRRKERDGLGVERSGHGAMQWLACPCDKVWRRGVNAKELEKERK
jgi:hypothetical protein